MCYFSVYFTFLSILQGEPITCDFPSVAPMEEGRLTCYFPEDVHRSQKDIVVYRHVLDGSPGTRPSDMNRVLCVNHKDIQI